MAEYVNQTLEEMIPELQEMYKIGLFTEKETKTILKHREGHEYKLRQQTKTKAMFLSYIEYEKKVLELIKIRRKKLGHDSKQRSIEKSVADRIHKLFRLVITRFPEDLNLWEQHIQFSKDMNEKAYVSRLYHQALSIHSNSEGLWMKAAEWENSKEGNCNSEVAREILLKAQRVLPESPIIILEMFRMELELARLVLKRKAVLGLLSKETQEKSESSQVKLVHTDELKLAEIVYRQGVQLFPDNPEFHLKMFHLALWFKEAKALKKLIITDLKRLYPTCPMVWNALALSYLHKVKKVSPAQRKVIVSKCLDTYSQAVAAVPTEEMWSLCLRGHLSILGLRELKDGGWALKSTLAMFERAIQLTSLSEDLFLDLVDLLTQLDMSQEVEQVARWGTRHHPDSPRLWLIRLRQVAASLDPGQQLQKMLEEALKKVAPEESWQLWQFVLNHFAMTKYRGLEELMEKACRNMAGQVSIPAKEWCLHWTFKEGGLKAARKTYQSLKNMRPISLQFYRLYVNIESAQVEPNLKLIRAAFEEALVEFGRTEPDVWQNYQEMEALIARDPLKSGQLYQRALHGLDPHLKEIFIRRQVVSGLGG